jgi:hypothetical protein
MANAEINNASRPNEKSVFLIQASSQNGKVKYDRIFELR